MEGVKTYKAYLSTGIPFTIVTDQTDHKALTCLNSLTDSQNGKLYIYKVVYQKGEQNNADALSRVTKEAQEVNQSEQNEAMVNTCSASKAGAKTKNELNATSANRSQNETFNSQCKMKKEEMLLLNAESSIQTEQEISQQSIDVYHRKQ